MGEADGAGRNIYHQVAQTPVHYLSCREVLGAECGGHIQWSLEPHCLCPEIS
jgi:hypothetical protein